MGYPHQATGQDRAELRGCVVRTLKELITNPGGIDSLANYAGEIPDEEWLVVLTHSRDDDTIGESNWRSALAMMGGESDDVQIFRFGHWACGWWEALCVIAGSASQEMAEEISSQLEDYPILDDEDYSELQAEKAEEIWRDCYSDSERIAYMRQYWRDFEDNLQTLPMVLACARGKFFGGNASVMVDG